MTVLESADFLIFVSSLVWTFLFIWLGYKLYSQSNQLQKLGKKLYDQKLDLLDSKSFVSLRKMRDDKATPKASLFLFVLISAKSLGMFAIALTLILPILLLFQGIAMGSLIAHYSTINNSKPLVRITFWQLVSHLLAAVPATIVGYQWLILDQNFLGALNAYEYYVPVLILTLVTSYVAAWLEAKNLMEIED